MNKISASLVKELRDLTGASVIDCQQALSESGGNIDKAREVLRKKGKEKARKKTDRETGEGVIATYVHGNKKIGTLVELRCETDFVAKNAEFQDLAHDLAMHVAAMSPKFLSFSKVPKEEKKEIEDSFRDEIASEKKPLEIVEKILEGKVRKHFEKMCLLEQEFIKDPNMTISDLINAKIAKIGENIRVERFTRYEI